MVEAEARRVAQAAVRAAVLEEERLGRERVVAAARLRALEGEVEGRARGVADLVVRRGEAEARLVVRAAELGPFLPLMERLGLFPAETLLAVPMAPEDAVRGLIVLGGMVRALEGEAALLRAEQAEVDGLVARLEVEGAGLTAAQAAQAAAGAVLDAQIAAAREARRVAEGVVVEAERRAAAAGARAADLRAALARIEEERRAAEVRAKAEAEAAVRARREADAEAARARAEALAKPAGPGLGSPKGVLTAPVAGSVVRGFGEATEGGAATGMTYQPAPGARVVSPCGGRVVYGGVFRSFGLLVIVDCGAGYHFVLSGFERLDAQVGQSVQAGEPVGQMPAWDVRGTAGRSSLYLELRRDGQAVNPAPYLRAKG